MRHANYFEDKRGGGVGGLGGARELGMHGVDYSVP